MTLPGVDIGIGASLFAIQCLLGLMGLKLKKRKEKYTFWALILVGLALTGITVFRASQATDQINAGLANAQLLVTRMDPAKHGQLQINLVPENRSSWTSLWLANIPSSSLPGIDIWAQNSGRAYLQNVQIAGKVYLRPGVGPPSDREFEEFLSKIKYGVAESFPPNDGVLNPHPYRHLNAPALSAFETADLENARSEVCVMVSVKWRDETGCYEQEINKCPSRYPQFAPWGWRVSAHNNDERPISCESL